MKCLINCNHFYTTHVSKLQSYFSPIVECGPKFARFNVHVQKHRIFRLMISCCVLVSFAIKSQVVRLIVRNRAEN